MRLALILFIFLTILFYIKGFMVLDPDLGWRLRMGELLLHSGIPTTDPFSYTMPSFPSIDHEWITHVVMWLIYQHVGVVMLAILFACLTSLSLLLPLYKTSIRIAYLPLFLASATLFSFAGVRPQVVTWIFFSIITIIITHKPLWIRWKWLLPLVLILWVNMHGAFAAGLTIIVLTLLVRSFLFKKEAWSNILLCLVSVMSTFVNPYGMRIWSEIALQITDHSLKWSIQEWSPAILVPLLSLWVYAALSIVFVVINRKKIEVTLLILYALLLVGTLSSIRHAPLWILFSLPITIISIEQFVSIAKRNSHSSQRLIKAAATFTGILIFFLLIQFTIEIKKASLFNEDRYYPTLASVYLQNQLPKGNIFSIFQWNSYLLWKVPEKKIFVSGMMPSWRRSVAPLRESSYAYKDYLQVLSQELSFASQARKYNIDTVVLPTFSDAPQTLSEKILDTRFNPSEQKKLQTLKNSLLNDGWTIVYRDKVTTIYQLVEAELGY